MRKTISLPQSPATVAPPLKGMPEENRSKVQVADEQPWQRAIREENAKLAALDADENPKDKNGRLMSTLMGLGRGFMRGGVLGAAAEGVRSGFAPNADERISRDTQNGKVSVRIGRLNAQRKADAEYDQTVAQTDNARTSRIHAPSSRH